MAVKMLMLVFSVVTLFRLISSNQHSGDIYYLHHQPPCEGTSGLLKNLLTEAFSGLLTAFTLPTPKTAPLLSSVGNFVVGPVTSSFLMGVAEVVLTILICLDHMTGRMAVRELYCI